MEVSEMGVPQVTMGFNTKMVDLDDFGVPLFQETPTYPECISCSWL